MGTVFREVLCCYARKLLCSGYALPFEAASETPLGRLNDNYLALVTGLPGLFGGTGSAVVIEPGLAVTNAHVVKAGPFHAYAAKGEVAAMVLALSRRLDLALLRVPEDLGEAIALGQACKGDAVWAMGTTTGRIPPTVAGRVENPDAHAFVEATRDAVWGGLMYAAGAGPGYSGGPVVDGGGRLVGITEGVFTHFFDGLGEARLARDPMMFAYRSQDVLDEVDRLLGRPGPRLAA